MGLVSRAPMYVVIATRTKKEILLTHFLALGGKPTQAAAAAALPTPWAETIVVVPSTTARRRSVERIFRKFVLRS